MTEIPKDKISCKICKYRGESPISGACEGCNYFSKFEIDYDKVCKWCYNPVADGDNICAEHRESHRKHSWPGCIVEDQKKQFAAHEITEKKARRERIATALMAGLFANAGMASITDKACADMAVIGADSLIAALDEVKE